MRWLTVIARYARPSRCSGSGDLQRRPKVVLRFWIHTQMFASSAFVHSESWPIPVSLDSVNVLFHRVMIFVRTSNGGTSHFLAVYRMKSRFFIHADGKT
jgi:hypothetical protein